MPGCDNDAVCRASARKRSRKDGSAAYSALRILTATLRESTWSCARQTSVTAGTLLPNKVCYAQVRTQNCQPPDDEAAPQCFSSCTPPPTTLSQENADMQLQYPPNTGGDVANENYCQAPAAAGTGDPNAPCANAKITPGAVQFYFTAGSCMSQNAQGATYVYSGEQYNWIVIYEAGGVPVTCNNCGYVVFFNAVRAGAFQADGQPIGTDAALKAEENETPEVEESIPSEHEESIS